MTSLDSVRFDQTLIQGWIKDSEDAKKIAWIDQPANPNVLVKQYSDQPLGLPMDDLNALRSVVRAFANEDGGGLISCDLAEKAGVLLIKVVEKKPMQTRGVMYEGTIYVPGKSSTIIFRLIFMERGTTGMRDTSILGLCFSQGIVAANVETREMVGWVRDPYDPDGKYPCMPNLSEDEKYDAQFPDHPLSRCREFMRKLENSLQFDDTFLSEEIGPRQSAAQQVDATKEADDMQSLIAAAQSGDPTAQVALGKAYRDGKGVAVNCEEAMVWMHKAAQAGYAEAQYQLGIEYDEGMTVSYDSNESERWHQMAAEQGHVKAQVQIGCILEERHLEVDAAQWFLKAAKEGARQGSSLGLSNYGRCLLHGIGVKQNLSEAVNFFNAALKVNPDDEAVLYMLGCCYDKGEGVTKDHERAFNLYKQSASHNYRNALYELGNCYLEGRGVARDRKSAMDAYDRAMRKGHKEATRRLQALREEETSAM